MTVKMIQYVAIVSLFSILLVVGCTVARGVFNSGVIRELTANPDGERARKVMLLTLPSGKAIPVNYLREDQNVYAGADFPWWRELRGDGGEVTVLIRGQTLEGHGQAIEGDSALRTSVFEKLRPTAPKWTGTLVEIVLDEVHQSQN
ncbi:MAG: hypothetical protein JRH16_16650 [Deltaproteobacteria bacterium]|nr:hypothetical protein [Deltaproteobacteria bacterium]